MIENPGPVLKAVIEQIRSSELVLKATPEEIEAFGAKPGQWIAGSVVTAATMNHIQTLNWGLLYRQPAYVDLNGVRTEIGHVDEIKVERSRIDVTTWDSSFRQYIPGVGRSIITVRG